MDKKNDPRKQLRSELAKARATKATLLLAALLVTVSAVAQYSGLFLKGYLPEWICPLIIAAISIQYRLLSKKISRLDREIEFGSFPGEDEGIQESWELASIKKRVSFLKKLTADRENEEALQMLKSADSTPIIHLEKTQKMIRVFLDKPLDDAERELAKRSLRDVEEMDPVIRRLYNAS